MSNLHEVARTAAVVEAGSIAEAVEIAAAAHRRDDTDERIAARVEVLHTWRRANPEALLTRARTHGLVFGEDWGSLIDSLARAEIASETLAAQSKADEELLVRFESWRDEVDCDHVLDTFTLAIAFFGGACVDHEYACDLAGCACDREQAARVEVIRALANRGAW
jgi:hypothetical protein